MRINILFQYLLAALVVILTFSVLLWQRSELIVKESIIDRTYGFLHDKNINKLKEVENKVDYYLLAAKDIYAQLSKNRENFQIRLMDGDIVGADLFIARDNKFSVYSTFVSKEYLKNRNLSDDYFKEIVGQNPLNFGGLQYQNVLLQKLAAEDRKSDLLAIIVRMKSPDQVTYSPYYLTLYIDLKRFNSVFQADSEFTQALFEPVGGLIGANGNDVTGASFNDVSKYPPFQQMKAQTNTIVKSKYTNSQTKEVIYFSGARGNYGIYITTEIKESNIYKPLYLLKANYSIAVGILISFIVSIFVILAINSSDKKRTIAEQLDSFISNRTVDLHTMTKIMKDDFDDISIWIHTTLEALAKVYNNEGMIKRFSHTLAAEIMQFKNVSVDGLRSNAVIAKIKLKISDRVDDDFAFRNYMHQRKSLFAEIEKLAQKSEGVFISMDNDVVTYAWGFLLDDATAYLRGIETVLEINALLRKQKRQHTFESMDYNIAISYGEVLAETFHFSSLQTLALTGKALNDLDHLLDYVARSDGSLDVSIVVSNSAKRLSEEFFGYIEVPCEQAINPQNTDQDETQTVRKEKRDHYVYLLTRKINDYVEVVEKL